VQSAEIAAKAKSTVEQLDEVVSKASHVNTPEAWNEARHIVSVARSSDGEEASPPVGEQSRPVQETDSEQFGIERRLNDCSQSRAVRRVFHRVLFVGQSTCG